MKGMISELRAGVGRVNEEILAAAGISSGGADATAAAEGGEVAAEAAERFNEVMVAFQEGSTAKLKQLEVRVPVMVDAYEQDAMPLHNAGNIYMWTMCHRAVSPSLRSNWVWHPLPGQ